VGTIPSKADVEAQDSYREKELEPSLEEAKAGKRAVFFVDASHFVMGAFVNFIWCFKRIFMVLPELLGKIKKQKQNLAHIVAQSCRSF
jgi:hypothetical protein